MLPPYAHAITIWVPYGPRGAYVDWATAITSQHATARNKGKVFGSR